MAFGRNEAVGIAFKGKDEVSPVVRGIRNTMDGLKRDAKQGFGIAAGFSVFRVGMDVMRGAVNLFGDAINEAAAFDAAMTQSLAIMGDVSDAMRDDMVNAARDVAKATTFSATQAAEAYFFLASAGLDAQESVLAMPKVAQFAQAGMFDLAEATDLLTDAQSALGLTVDNVGQNMENMSRISDVLVKANTLANASVEQFSTALTSKAGAALKSFGIDVEEGVAVLGAFADQGIKAEEAGNALDRILRLLPDSALRNADAFKEFGIAVFDSEGELRNMGDIVADMEQAFFGLSDAELQAGLSALGFQARVQGMVKPLLGTSSRIRRYEKELRSAGGTTEEVADKQLETFNAQLDRLGSHLTDIALEVGPHFLGFLGDIVDNLTGPDGASKAIRDLADGIREVGDVSDFEAGKTSAEEYAEAIDEAAARIRDLTDPATADMLAIPVEVLDWIERMGPRVAVATGGTIDDLVELGRAVSETGGDYERFRKAVADYILEARLGSNIIQQGTEAQTEQAEKTRLLREEVVSLGEAWEKAKSQADDFADARPLQRINRAIQKQVAIRNRAFNQGKQQRAFRAQARINELQDEKKTRRAANQAARDFMRQMRQKKIAQLAETNRVQKLAETYGVNERVVARVMLNNRKDIDKTKRRLEALGRTKAEPDVGLDTAEFDRKYGAVMVKIGILLNRAQTAALTFAANAFGGGKAHGGPVEPGRTYLVGERGPELLTMGSTGGHVTSNRDMRRGGGGNVYLDGQLVGRVIDGYLGDRFSLAAGTSDYRS